MTDDHRRTFIILMRIKVWQDLNMNWTVCDSATGEPLDEFRLALSGRLCLWHALFFLVSFLVADKCQRGF